MTETTHNNTYISSVWNIVERYVLNAKWIKRTQCVLTSRIFSPALWKYSWKLSVAWDCSFSRHSRCSPRVAWQLSNIQRQTMDFLLSSFCYFLRDEDQNRPGQSETNRDKLETNRGNDKLEKCHNHCFDMFITRKPQGRKAFWLSEQSLPLYDV